MKKARAVEIENKIVAAPYRANTFPRFIDGIEEAIRGGVYAGYQVIDIKAQVVDGTFHEVDSNELAFKMARHFRAEGRVQESRPDPARAHHESGKSPPRMNIRAICWVN